MSEKRIFETDDKFWEVWIDGSQVFTHFGKTGAAGQTKIKPTADASAAEATLEDMVAKKKKEGFKQTGGPKPPAGPALDAKELKKLLAPLTSAQDPAVMVLADWLQGQNHPWGELIALQYAAATTPKKAAALEKAAAKLLEDQREAILGELADDTATEITVWRSGFAQTAVVGSLAESKAILAALKKFLAHPLAKVVEKIVLAPVQKSFVPWQDWDDSEAHIVDPWDGLEAIAKALPARITELGFGAWPPAAAAAYTNLPSFAKLAKTFPQLTKLDLNGTGIEKPGKLSLPALTDLRIHFSMAREPDLVALASSKLPKLERLTLGLGGSVHAIVDEVQEPDEHDYDGDEDDDEDEGSRYQPYGAGDMEGMNGYGDLNASNVDLAPLLGTAFPALTELSFESTYLNDGIVNAIVKSKLLKQVKSLDLSSSRFNDAGLQAFLGAKKQLAHLETIDLRKCGLDDKAQKKVKAALPNAKLDKGKDKGPAFFFRYLATME
jgi:predicted DNA-binding WGR domain protein